MLIRVSFGQTLMHQSDYFIPPVSFPMLLSGNFGELRGSHFHTGIDIKTKGRTGHKVFAVADGYVSRIKVSPYGYGNALYIAHPDGYTSVYAHLEGFSIQIEEYVRIQQYSKKQFAVNLFPDPGFIQVSQGDIIGTTGNSGGSLGPHLHFELRKTSTEKPQNPLKIAYKLKDNISPRFHNIYLYPVSDCSLIDGKHDRTLFNCTKSNGVYRLTDTDTVHVADSIGIGVYVNDYLNNTQNRCGIYDLTIRVDGEVHYHLRMDELSFYENRYVLSHMDYGLKVDLSRRIHKCFVEPNNKFSNYLTAKNNGLIHVNPGQVRNIQIVAEDANGNRSLLRFYLKGGIPRLETERKGYAMYMDCKKTINFTRDEIMLSIPIGALYSDLEFNYEFKPQKEGFYSGIHRLHQENVPLHKYFTIKIKSNSIPDSLKSKLYLAGLARNGRTWCASSTVKLVDNWAVTKIRNFGEYVLLIDSIAPTIKPVNIYPGKNMSESNNIKLIVSDSETGVKSYNGYIDEQWVLFEYDAKNDLLSYFFDEYMSNREKHMLKIIVKDKMGNTTELKIPFTYKSKTS